MDNKLRYFLTAFFGSLIVFILITYGQSLIMGREQSLIAIIGRILIYFTVPIFILVLVNVYMDYFSKRLNLYMQIVAFVILLVIMLTIWSYLDGRGSRFLRMGFLNYWLRMLQSSWFAIVYFGLAVPILTKFSKRKAK